MDNNLLEHITKQFLECDLPGREAMLKMAPISRRKQFQLRKDHNLASVMMLIYPSGKTLNFPLIIRTNKYPNDKHSGQIAFPGGKREPGDHSNWHCAIRETEEELGISTGSLKRLGALTPNYIPVSNYLVYPFVAYIPERPVFNRQEDEVADIIEVDLPELLDPSTIKSGDIRLPSGINLVDIPYFELSGRKVWGATAMILNEFVQLIKSHPEQS